jgi:cell pole-organizing protein PopZ
MNMTEKNGQPSMEEILASIRRIIAEEPSGHSSHGELRGTPIMLKGDGALDDAGDFDLPAIFRSSPPAAAERQAPLLGRLTDAIRGAAAAQPEARGLFNGDEEPIRSAPVDGGALSAEPSVSPNAGLSSLKPVVRPSEPAPSSDPRLSGSPAAAPDPREAQSGAFPAAAPSGAVGADAPKRVMAPFKDTHFLRMSAPPSGASSSPFPADPAPAAPVVAQPAPAVTPPAASAPVDFGAIIPGQIERPSLVLSPSPVAVPQAPEVQQQPYTVPVPAQPAVAAPPPPLPSAIASAPVAAPAPPVSASQPEATGTIEDATADLLRPMLRQWLADNMPRMVEKALHIEIAESVKAPKKP